MWQNFFLHYNGVSLYRRQLFFSPDIVHICSDAAQSLGYSAILGTHWFFGAWPSEWWLRQNIVFLELIPIVLELEIWGPLFSDKVVSFHTDNLALVSIINNQKSKEPLVMLSF